MLVVNGYYPGVIDFGRRVRAVREARDLQQMEVARAVAKTESQAKSFSNYLSRIERGDEDNPSLDKIEQIAKGLGLSIFAFFRQLERPTRESPDELRTSALRTGKPLVNDAAAQTPEEGSADAAPQQIDRLAERFARSLVEHVNRGLAEGDRPAPKTGGTKSPRGRRVRRRRA
jgi:transcriptional regulator with XRE-family HTH domain